MHASILKRAVLAVLASVCVSATTLVSPLLAQRVRGPGDDATVLRRGTFRIGIATHWSFAHDRFARSSSSTPGEAEPLGADFSADQLGPAFGEFLEPIAIGLATLTGQTTPALSLGSFQTRMSQSVFTTPITLEFGLTDRLLLGVEAPYVKTRNDVVVSVNNPPGLANLGLNPAASSTTARTTNAAVVGQLQTAAGRLQTELTRCAGSTDPTCSAINADRAGATALVTQATLAATTVGTLYGTSTIPGARFAPLSGSLLQKSVDDRLTALSSAFATYLGAPTTGTGWVTARPVPGALLGTTGLQDFLSDPEGGIAATPLESVERSHLGDVALGGKWLLVDRIGRGDGSGLRARLAVGAYFRLGTAQAEFADDLGDVGTGDRQRDIEMRGFADVAIGRRILTSVVARYTRQLADEREMRITDLAGEPFPPLYRRQVVQRDLGDIVEIEVTPRFVPSDLLAIGVAYRYRRKAADEYAGTFSVLDLAGVASTLDASTLGLETEQEEQRVLAGVTYSTLAAFERGRSRWPLDVTLMYARVFAGTNALPRWSTTSIGIRYYSRLLGGNSRSFFGR